MCATRRCVTVSFRAPGNFKGALVFDRHGGRAPWAPAFSSMDDYCRIRNHWTFTSSGGVQSRNLNQGSAKRVPMAICKGAVPAQIRTLTCSLDPRKLTGWHDAHSLQSCTQECALPASPPWHKFAGRSRGAHRNSICGLAPRSCSRQAASDGALVMTWIGLNGEGTRRRPPSLE